MRVLLNGLLILIILRGYEANYTMNEFMVVRSWWEFVNGKDTALTFKFEGSNGTFVQLDVYVSLKEWIWGLLTGEPLIQVWTNGTWVDSGAMMVGDMVKVYAWRNTYDHLSVRVLSYRTFQLESETIALVDETFVMSDGWFENFTVSVMFKHSGSGNCSFGLVDMWHTDDLFVPDYESYGYPKYPSLFDLVGDLIFDALPVEVQGWVMLLAGWFDAFIVMVVPLWGFALQIVPILPYLVLFWALDAVFSCIKTGDIQPLGVCFSTILHLATSVVNVLISVIHVVYDFIHFLVMLCNHFGSYTVGLFLGLL